MSSVGLPPFALEVHSVGIEYQMTCLEPIQVTGSVDKVAQSNSARLTCLTQLASQFPNDFESECLHASGEEGAALLRGHLSHLISGTVKVKGLHSSKTCG